MSGLPAKREDAKRKTLVLNNDVKNMRILRRKNEIVHWTSSFRPKKRQNFDPCCSWRGIQILVAARDLLLKQ